MVEASIRETLVIDDSERGYCEFEIGDDVTIETSNGDMYIGELDEFNDKDFSITNEDGDSLSFYFKSIDSFYN